MDNKKILHHCPNFYKISNFEYNEKDYISERLIGVYKEYIFNIDLSDQDQVNKIENLDKIISKYIDDYFFRKEMRMGLKEIKIKKTDNIIESIVNQVIKIFERYEEGYTRNIYLSRWI